MSNAYIILNLKVSFTQVATDGLIIQGWYNTITLAVYGSMTTVEREKAVSPPPPPPPLARSKPQGTPILSMHHSTLIHTTMPKRKQISDMEVWLYY